MSPCSRFRFAPAGAWLVLLSSACRPELVVGEWQCPEHEALGADAGWEQTTVDAPWSTGFERGFCDYARAGGRCYATPDASFEIVDTPVHGGRRAAAFSIDADLDSGEHTRCFLEGTLPVDATYGAWFYLPEHAENTGNWNLFHFRKVPAPAPPDRPHLWDVSLGNADDGTLFLYVFDFLGAGIVYPESPPAVPIGSWFHVEFRLRRAADETGAVALYQDGELVLELENIRTHDSDYAQWYVGNLADSLSPAQSTIYVDDVTIQPPR